jgi:hypothetical protein
MSNDGIRDHLRTRGVLHSAFVKQYMGNNALYTTEMVGTNAKNPYLPWGISDRGMSPADKRQMAADYLLVKNDYMINLDRRVRQPSISTSVNGVHPSLIHPTELARMGAAVNPTPLLQNPVVSSRTTPDAWNPNPAATDFASILRQNGAVGPRKNSMY